MSAALTAISAVSLSLISPTRITSGSCLTILLKPFEMLTEGVEAVITYEEHLLAGGLGSIVAEFLADKALQRRHL